MSLFLISCLVILACCASELEFLRTLAQEKFIIMLKTNYCCMCVYVILVKLGQHVK